MSSTINIVGTGGIIEGNLETANVNVNLDAPYTFDGTDDFFHVADHNDFDLSSTWTISAWFYADSTMAGSTIPIIAKNGTSGSDAARPYTIVYSTSLKILRVYIGDNSAATVFDSNALTEDCWHHVALTYNDSNDDIKMYIDGQTSGTGYTENLSYTRQTYNSTKSLSIGGFYTNDTGSGSNFWKGHIADVRIYNTDIGATDIPVLASKINPDITLGAGSTNLVAHWPLLNGSANDAENATKGASSTDHDLTAVGSPAQDYDAFSVNVQDNSTQTDGTFTVTQGKVEGKALSALEFNGSNQEIALNGNLSMAGDFTFSTWFNADEFDNNVLLAKGSDSSCVIRISNSGAITFNFNNQGEEAISGITFAGTGAWTHLVITRDYSTGKTDVYVNGVYQSTATFDSGNATGNFDVIGKGSSYYWDGHLRDMRMYDAIILSADQIASLYSGTYPVMPKYWWKMDEGTGLPLSTGTESISNPSDTGANGATVDAVWDNGTLNLDGALTIATAGTLSAPRGNLTMGAAFHSNATDPNTQFIHNN